MTAATIIIIIAAFFIGSLGLVTSTKDLRSAIVFKVVPVTLGLLLSLVAAGVVK